MKYFNNITTVEELKKAYRAQCLTMHPDRGGDAESFKAMVAEYEQLQGVLTGEPLKQARRQAVSIRRGTKVIIYGYAMNYRIYTVVSNINDTVELVEVSDCECNGVDFFDCDDTAEEVEDTIYKASQTINVNKYNHIKPLSAKFGIGVYYDDVEGKIYTEDEIQRFIKRADNIKKYGAQVKAMREEAARKAKEAREAAEMLVINEWRQLLQVIPEGATDTKRKAILKANIKAIFAHYFPGVSVKVSDTSRGWSGRSSITWTDGPTEAEVKAVKEFDYFFASYSYIDETDYCNNVRIEAWEQWRDLFGVWSAESVDYRRTLSEVNEQTINNVIDSLGVEWFGRDEEGKISINTGSARMTYANIDTLISGLGEDHDIKEGVEDNPLIKGLHDYFWHADCVGTTEEGACINRVYRTILIEIIRRYYHISKEAQQAQTEAENKPKFTAKHNDTYKAVLRALGSNCFIALGDNKDFGKSTVLTPLEAAEKLATGEVVGLGHFWDYDGIKQVSGVEGGGYKTRLKRRDKFANVGFAVVLGSNYCNVKFNAVTPEVLEALRADAADIERQREAWEAGAQDKKQTTNTQHQTTNTQTTTGAAPEGLEPITINGGVAVTGDSRATYKARKEIKAHGATWNRDTKQWEATTEEAVVSLREWFGLSDDDQTEAEPEPTQAEAVAEPEPELTEAEAVAEPEPELTEAEAVAEDQTTNTQQPTPGAQFPEALTRFIKSVQELRELLQIVQESGENARRDAERAEAETQAEAMAKEQTTNTQHQTTNTQNAQQPTPNTPQWAEAIATFAGLCADIINVLTDGGGNPPTVDPVRLKMWFELFKRAAQEAEELTEANEHTRALHELARALISVLDYTPLIVVCKLMDKLEEIEANQKKRGHITPEELATRAEISEALQALTLKYCGFSLGRVLWGWSSDQSGQNAA